MSRLNIRLPFRATHAGSALVSTLLVIVVMSIIVAAFLQSMTMERQTARSYLNQYRAELASTAGADMAKALIYETISQSQAKVNFVTWAYSPDATTFSPFYAGILPDAIPLNPGTQAGVNSVTGTVWLFSGPPAATGKGTDPELIKKLVAAGNTVEICNVNFPISSSRNPDTASSTGPLPQRYWIDQSGTEYKVGWIDLPVAGDPSIRLRYAFWVDDEMGRADISALGNSAQKVPKGKSYSDPENPEAFEGAGNLVLNDNDSKENGDQRYFRDADMAKIIADRVVVGLSPMSANQLIDRPDSNSGAKPPNPNLARDSLAFTARNPATMPDQSATDSPSVYDLVPYGAQAGKPKLNINDAVTQETDSKKSVQKIHDFIKSALAENKEADTGSAYYDRKNSPPGNVWRIAASIHDYIDDETQPTIAKELEDHFANRLANAYDYVFKKNGTGEPQQPIAPDWEGIALEERWYGIKPVPFFNAFDFDGTMQSEGEPYNDYTAKYTFYLWNPSDKPFQLQDCYIMVFNSPFKGDPKGDAKRADNGSPVEGLPYFRWDVFQVPPQTIQPMAQVGIALQKNYKIKGSIKSKNLSTTSTLGFILFKRGADEQIHVLDGYLAGGVINYNRDSNSPGGQISGKPNEWDTKDRRQNLSLHQSVWSLARNARSNDGKFANYQDFDRWYDRSEAAKSPTTPITHIPLAPMASLGELGNIFDPVNDIGVGVGAGHPGGTIPARPLPKKGTYVSRGGKTLNVGQFDDFFDRLQKEEPKNPLIDKIGEWTSYEKYLRFADTALFDMLTIRTPEESRNIVPLNINSPRPGKLSSSDKPGDPGLNPLSTYLGAMTSTLGADALGGKDKDGKPFQGINSGIPPVAGFSTAVRERLSDPDWTACRPFRNYSDLMLLGINKKNLASAIRENAAQSMFSAKNASPATGPLPPFYLNKRSPLSITLGQPPGSPPPVATVQLGTNFQRQAQFARLAEQTTFRSYRYRIYAVGQVVSTKDPSRPLSTVHQSFIYDLNPTYDETTQSVTFNPTLQSVVDN